MAPKKVLYSLLAMALGLSTTVHAQDNPGVCPQDNGKYRTAQDGTYLIDCNRSYGMGKFGTPGPQPTLADCIDACGKSDQCRGINYDVTTTICQFLNKNNPPSAANQPSIHHARKVDKPAPTPEQQKPIVDPVDPQPVAPKPIVDPVDPNSQTGSGDVTTNPTCPGDDGKTFLSDDGTYYKLQCGYHSTAQMVTITKGTADSYAACMNKCTNTVGCISIKYQARQGSGQGQYKGCHLYSSDGPSTEKCGAGTEDFAYTVDPPVQDASDYPNKLCSTECPYADGMTYSSKFGEAFKMDCAKRHGTAYFGIAQAASFKDCMDTCAQFVPCHSVDYHTNTGRCYLGSHHGNPTIAAGSFMSAHSIGCSGACGECCGGIGGMAKNQTTSEVALITKGPCEPDLSCNNKGLIYGAFPGKAGAPSTTTLPADMSFMKTDSAAFKGSTSKLGLASTSDIYGHPSSDNNILIMHYGYIFSQEAGEYTFETGAVDDYVYMWVGPNAVNSWTKDNADTHASYAAQGNVASKKVNLEACSYTPLRIAWGNTGGAGKFQPRILAPNGTVIVDQNTNSSPYLVQFPCDEFNGAKFGFQTTR